MFAKCLLSLLLNVCQKIKPYLLKRVTVVYIDKAEALKVSFFQSIDPAQIEMQIKRGKHRYVSSGLDFDIYRLPKACFEPGYLCLKIAKPEFKPSLSERRRFLAMLEEIKSLNPAHLSPFYVMPREGLKARSELPTIELIMPWMETNRMKQAVVGHDAGQVPCLQEVEQAFRRDLISAGFRLADTCQIGFLGSRPYVYDLSSIEKMV